MTMTISLSELATLRVLVNEMQATIDRMESGEGLGVNRIVVSGAKRSKTGGTETSPPGGGEGAVPGGSAPEPAEPNVTIAKQKEPASQDQIDLMLAFVIERELSKAQEEKLRQRIKDGLSLFDAEKALDWLGTLPIRAEFADRPF